MRRDLLGLTIVALAVTVATYVTYMLFTTTKIPNETIALAVSGAVAAITLASWLFLIRRTVGKHRRSLNVALIGPPAAGKTVFSTVLFRELERGAIGSLLFMPHGVETIERVRRDLTGMAGGSFPPRTVPGEHFEYEALARFRRIFFDREYRLRLTDFAGEYLMQSAERQINEDPVFLKGVGESEALFMMVDCEVLMGPLAETADVENRLIAVLNYIALGMARERTEKIKIPVALLLSKADLLPEEQRSSTLAKANILDRLTGLRKVCESRCRYFKVFFLSATGGPGHVKREGLVVPPNVLEPEGVLEPLLWILGRGTA